ncbi:MULTISPECIES: IucA/IucC family protein [Hafnia]|uniref:IucA/IucC family protein n=1 Tax=Hafnia TaxID=568 RepID=UPI00141A652F|nr:IucA/IucC family siderophore biosynthesis protein [Hafnia paralvei]NIH29703.1 IucA/IucC family siderophore biosynthesis protein [Hafnia paralvei]UBM41511.1 IucA/IucC family siderophore biosynthesis protein [Hafnia paralvei]
MTAHTQFSHLPVSEQNRHVIAHLTPELWSKANRLHVRKAIAEFAHERLITPKCIRHEASPEELADYQLAAPQGDVVYHFRARRLALEHWAIDAESLRKTQAGVEQELDSLSFIIEFKDVLGIPQEMLPTYMEEITSTLYSSAFKHLREGVLIEQLLDADFQTLEGAMMEGHPAFVANNGRIGFDAFDYQAYAPEAAAPINFVWLAAHKSKAHFASIEELSYQQLLEEELTPSVVDDFRQQLMAQDLDPTDYIFMPVHPWQWQNKLTGIFAPDIAKRELVYLGIGDDNYQAQQSIRTFFNTSNSRKRYVKTALSILNMGFMRGLSPYYMATTPGINEWLAELIDNDACLRDYGFRMLREVATIGYHNHYYESAVSGDTPYKKMMAALWRESPLALIQPNQRVMTMAALLHQDREGNALLPAMIQASGLETGEWLKRYLQSYLSPLLHCLYTYDLAFMPHGENLILVLENHTPVHVFMKDIAEEIVVMDPDANLPEKAKRVAVFVPDELKILSIFTDVFDGFFRFMAAILHEQGSYPQEQFWHRVAECVTDYQQAHPELAERFARYDMFSPAFTHSCLNRLQLANNRQMINLSDPSQNLKFAGQLDNPLVVFK